MVSGGSLFGQPYPRPQPSFFAPNPPSLFRDPESFDSQPYLPQSFPELKETYKKVYTAIGTLRLIGSILFWGSVFWLTKQEQGSNALIAVVPLVMVLSRDQIQNQN